jgi:tetratricopeptide (TPR) repeat protein
MRRTIPHAAAFLLLAAGAWACARGLSAVHERPFDIWFVPTEGAARWASLGHPTLAANLQWLRAVQYMGEERGRERGFGALRPVIELVTDLDPRHDYVYQVSANILAAEGLVRDANELLQKGIRNCPDKYVLAFHRAVNAFLYGGDYAEAGRWFEVAASTPGAPVDRMRAYATTAYAKGRRADAALEMLQDLYDAAKDDESRRSISDRMDVVRFESVALALEHAVDRYRARHHVYPAGLLLLALDGILPALPRDPLGGTWYLDFDEKRVRSTSRHDRWNRPVRADGAGARTDDRPMEIDRP